MKFVRDKIDIPSNRIKSLEKSLACRDIKKVNFRIEKELFSIFSLKILFKPIEYINMDGEFDSNLRMNVTIYKDKNNEIFTEAYDIYDIVDIFKIINFTIDKCEYFISIEEDYNSMESYERKRNLLDIRNESKSDINYMLKFIDFKNKYEVIDIMYLILFDIDIIKKDNTLIDTLYRKLDYYGCDIENEGTDSAKCIYCIYDALKSVNNNFEKFNKYTIRNKLNIIYNNYVEALVNEKIIKRY